MPVSEVKSCAYNEDTNAIDVEFADGKKMTILCNIIEESLGLAPAAKSKFIWLIDNEPETFVELHLSGELETYLDWYAKSYNEQESNIRRQLEQNYDSATARVLAREFMMYDS